MNQSTQTWTCNHCGKHCERPTVRGHHPKWCPECRAKSAWQIKTFVCRGCGEMATNQGGNYCSHLCRVYVRFGPQSSSWPKPAPRTPKPKPTPFTPIDADCEWCGDKFLAHRPAMRFCSRKHKSKASRARRRALELGAPGSYTWAEVTSIWLTIDRCCAYCAGPKRNDEIEPDHVVPLSRGGSNSIVNVVPCCKPCNSDKRDLSLDEWSADRARRNLEPRSLDVRIRHLSWITPAA